MKTLIAVVFIAMLSGCGMAQPRDYDYDSSTRCVTKKSNPYSPKHMRHIETTKCETRDDNN